MSNTIIFRAKLLCLEKFLNNTGKLGGSSFVTTDLRKHTKNLYRQKEMATSAFNSGENSGNFRKRKCNKFNDEYQWMTYQLLQLSTFQAIVIGQLVS